MKKQISFLALLLLTLVLAGCATCRPCEKKAEAVPQATVQAVAAPVVPVAESVVAEEEIVEEKIPAAVMK